MKKCKKIFLFLILAILCVLAVPGKEAQAGTTYPLRVSGTECNQKAFEVLEQINEERTRLGLGTVKMDANLMEAAMQRAHELAVSFSHNRPDQDADNANPNWYEAVDEAGFVRRGYTYENIAMGQTTAQEAVKDWVESKGHYENLTQPNAVSTGVGVFYHQGVYYWVQLFSEKQAQDMINIYETSYEIKDKTVTILDSILKKNLYHVYSGEHDFVPYGKNITINIRMKNANTDVGSYCQFTQDSFSWSSENSSILDIDAFGNVTGTGCGTTTIYFSTKGTILRGSFKMSCCVPLNETTITGLYSEYPYTGEEIKPASETGFAITFNGKTLIEGTDYTVSYKDNIYTSNSSAFMYIEGKGNYAGRITKTFKVAKLKAAGNVVVTANEREKRENETATEYIESIIQVRLGDRILVCDKDYVVSPSSVNYSKDADTGAIQYMFRIFYMPAYGGKEDQFYSISKFPLEAIANQVYTGNQLKPKVYFQGDSRRPKEEGVDYTVSYKNNKNVGTATVTVIGTGKKYIGSINTTFQIVNGNNAGANTNNGSNNTGSNTNGTGTATQSKKKVTFNANGGSCSTKSKSYTVGSPLSTLPKVTRTGYTLKGWYTKKSGGTKVGSTTKVNGTLTLYAQWSKVKVGKASISALSVGKKKVTVTTKKVSGANGYQIRYSTKSNMKSSKTVTTTSLKKTVSKLKKGTRYYFKVRAYKKDSKGNKVYGSWSTKKQCKKVK